MLRMGGLAILAFALTGSAAAAEGTCVDCYRRVVRPPVITTVKEKVVLEPARSVTHFTAPVHAINSESVVQRPAKSVPYWAPAVYETIDERVMIAPPRKAWRVTVNARGETVRCWCDVPAIYGVRQRRVLARPAGVAYAAIPAIVEYVPTFRTARMGFVTQGTVPAVYGVRERQVVVDPGYTAWQPIGRTQ